MEPPDAIRPDPMSSVGRPLERTVFGSDTPDPTRCGAKLRRSDPPRYCTQHKVRGNARCRIHGGVSPRGVANASFRTGTHSRYVPTRMRASYDEALNDPEILSLRHEIAERRATCDLLRRRLDDADGAGQGLQTAWRDFKAAHRAGNADRLADALTRLDGAMTARATEDGVRKELRAETELLSKLTRAENDRLEQLHQMLSREQALAYMRGLAVSVKEAVEAYVADREVRSAVLRAVSAKFEQLADRRDRPDARARGAVPELVGAEAGD